MLRELTGDFEERKRMLQDMEDDVHNVQEAIVQRAAKLQTVKDALDQNTIKVLTHTVCCWCVTISEQHGTIQADRALKAISDLKKSGERSDVESRFIMLQHEQAKTDALQSALTNLADRFPELAPSTSKQSAVPGRA